MSNWWVSDMVNERFDRLNISFNQSTDYLQQKPSIIEKPENSTDRFMQSPDKS